MATMCSAPVLLKPDPRTSVCGGVAIVRIFQAAGIPEGLLQLLPGAAPVGEAMVTAPQVRIVSFTGSTRAGRAVAELGGRHLKRVHLELGGNSALLVLPGANVSLAASAGAFGSFAHQGQICSGKSPWVYVKKPSLRGGVEAPPWHAIH
jgi:benzaldehyde dehydrogenase (NAD)